MTKNWNEFENDSESCVKIISEQYYNILQTQQEPLNFVTLKGIFAAFLVIHSIDKNQCLDFNIGLNSSPCVPSFITLKSFYF